MNFDPDLSDVNCLVFLIICAILHKIGLVVFETSCITDERTSETTNQTTNTREYKYKYKIFVEAPNSLANSKTDASRLL